MKWWGWVILVAFLAIIGIAMRQRAIARSNGFRADSLEAVVDTTRVLIDGERKVWGRRLLQADLKADSLDKLLKLKPTVVIQPVVHVDTLTDTVYAPVTGDSIREGSFRVRQPPFTVSATAALPPPPSQGRLALTVALDSIVLGVRVGCGEKVGGIRPATATVEAPAWASVHLNRVQGNRDVCNPSSPLIAGKTTWKALVGVLVGGFVGGAIAF